MEKKIAKWYRVAGIAENNEVIDKRIKAINSIVESNIWENNEKELVKLYFDSVCEKKFFDEFVECFYAEDNTFADDKTKEISLLAGIILYKIVEDCKDSYEVTEIGLWHEIAKFMRKKSKVSEIEDFIQECLNEKRQELRENLSFDMVKFTNLTKDISFSSSEEETPEYNKEVEKKLTLMVSKINSIVKSIGAMQTGIINREQILYEDSQVLWWMLAEYSDDESEKYALLEQKKAAILIGKDLATKINVSPGPYSAKAVLNKVLGENADAFEQFKDYVDACDDDIISKIIINKSMYTPLLYALNQKKECGEKNWYKKFEDIYSKGAVNVQYSRLEIAYEMYIECMFMNDYE